jgi:hypothetical protein
MEIAMYCTNCGKENIDPSDFCNNCGNPFFAQVPIKKMNVVLLIFLTWITFGIYAAVWFLRNRDYMNKLQSEQKIKKGIFIFFIIILSLSYIVPIFFAIIDVPNVNIILGEGVYSIIGLFRVLIKFVFIAFIISRCFKVFDIFNDHYNKFLKRGIELSGPLTFFFSIFYLQYKMNRF